MKIKLIILSYLIFFTLNIFSQTKSANRIYEIWDNQPAPNRGQDYSRILDRGFPADSDWETHSYPIGNGYMGANLFGRTDVERIQITDKTLTNGAPYGKGGMTNFAEIFLKFDHNNVSNYKRSLNLNEGISFVKYENKGITYSREYFASYPNNVIVIKLNASEKAGLSFTLSTVIPYLRSINENLSKFGTTTAKENTITLAGTIPSHHLNYEAQVKVLNEGGKLIANNENGAEIKIVDANSATILITTGTNYQLSDHIFLTEDVSKKLKPDLFPHDDVSKLIATASTLGYENLKKQHLKDYQDLFSRVNLAFAPVVTNVPTKTLVKNYKQNPSDIYLEELMFHFGRYLLIASSRKGTLPAGLQGVWSQYHVSPWSGGYWHNINIQMNYWGAFNANLSETFIPYEEYFSAYLPKAYKNADKYIKEYYPNNYSKTENGNGWCIGTGSDAYSIAGAEPGGHSGPGTGGFTTKLFWDRYEFTKDTSFLRKVAYPAILGMSTFLSKTLEPAENGKLLVSHSASPEQRDKNGKYIQSKGTTFDQGFVWETFNDLLKSAKILGIKDPFLETIKIQIKKLDPILIGESGQIKEYREENKYGEIGDPKHRHISQLCPIYPGTLINSEKPEWVKATSVVLDFRGNQTTGWALAHRMNVRARTKEAEKAHEVYSKFLKDRTLPNLWTVHPPFQIDGNLGVMAGVVEMLIQSQEGFIELLPALPKAWETGSFEGLMARGNFKLSLNWEKGKLNSCEVLSKEGGKCNIKYKNIGEAQIKDSTGKIISYTKKSNNTIEFDTNKLATYYIVFL